MLQLPDTTIATKAALASARSASSPATAAADVVATAIS